MATTVTLNVTGRDIVSALRAGKSVMVHSEVDGFEEYTRPASISFSEAEDTFGMSVSIARVICYFNGSLDDPLTYSSDGGGK